MAVKIRLKRMGKIRSPYYRVVVVDARKKRDGRVIEEIGKYDPMQEPSFIEINSERALYWLGVGAQPSDTAHKLLNITGDYAKFKGAKNTAGTLKVKETADKSVLAQEAIKEAEDRALKLKAKIAAAEAEAKAAAAAEAKAAEEAAEAAVEETPAEEAPEAEVAPEAEASAEAPAEAEEAE